MLASPMRLHSEYQTSIEYQKYWTYNYLLTAKITITSRTIKSRLPPIPPPISTIGLEARPEKQGKQSAGSADLHKLMTNFVIFGIV